MKIAIVGTGISGLTCGWLLHHRHDITLLEANDYIGGHTNTVDVTVNGRNYSVDTGFIVCNDRTYPNFLKLIDHLGVSRSPTTMGFSVRCDAANLEYCGSGIGGLFVQKRNLIRPQFLKMFADILRFNRQGEQDAESVRHDMTVGDYLDANGYGQWFAEYYLLPMGAAIWSCPTGKFRQFPIRFILEFYRNHGLLSLTNRPTWYVVDGGSQRYVEALTAPFRDRIRLSSPVREVRRTDAGVVVNSDAGSAEFDEIIFACHSDQALALLADPSPDESEILQGFPYEANTAVLHTDTSLLPRRRGAWSSWNYRLRREQEARATLTYSMNELQRIDADVHFCVSLNDTDEIDPARVLSRHQYSHPVFSTRRHELQQRHSEIIRRRRTSFCGAYWGNGFHEDGVVSALHVCQQYGAGDVLDHELSLSGDAASVGSG